MKLSFYYIFLTLFFFSSQIICGQNVIKFTYGGNSGKRYKATVKVSYVVKHNGRIHEIPDSTKLIDLNKYRGSVQFGIQFKELKVGLNNLFSKVKNSDHPKVYYLECIKSKVNIEGYSSVGLDTIRITANSGHYGKPIDNLMYLIKESKKESNLLFQARIRIIDGVYDRSWNGPLITKKLTILPKIVLTQKPQIVKAGQKKRKKHRYKNDKTPHKIVKDTITRSFDQIIWDKIEIDLVNDNESSLYGHCETYLKICDQYITKECEQLEDVLYYLTQIAPKSEKEQFIKRYKKQFPEGKYLSLIDKNIEHIEDASLPILDYLPHFENDTEVIFINRIFGGKKPYYIGFFDTNKNKDHPIKSIRFNKESVIVRLSTLDIPEGNYDIKVYDTKGDLFITKSNISVNSNLNFPKSLKLSVILVFIGSVFYLYKRYISI